MVMIHTNIDQETDIILRYWMVKNNIQNKQNALRLFTEEYAKIYAKNNNIPTQLKEPIPPSTPSPKKPLVIHEEKKKLPIQNIIKKNKK
jgi:hypothetical protein